MATIIIRRTQGLTPEGNVVNALRQIANTGVSQFVRGKLMVSALGTDSVNVAELEAARSKNFNALELSIENTTAKTNDTLTFIGAKIDIRKVHTIVSTPISVGDGSVKELINAQDYDINISGIIYIDKSEYPFEQIEAVNNFFSIKKTMQVVNPYCNAFKINHAVFAEGDFNQTAQNYTNVLPFRFRLISDVVDYGLVIK